MAGGGSLFPADRRFFSRRGDDGIEPDIPDEATLAVDLALRAGVLGRPPDGAALAESLTRRGFRPPSGTAWTRRQAEQALDAGRIRWAEQLAARHGGPVADYLLLIEEAEEEAEDADHGDADDD